MFKNEFQGALFLDIISVQGKDFFSKCKLVGSSTSGGQREFDKSIKSNILILEGESTRSKVIIPKDEKQSLYILQPFLVIQVLVLPGVSFSLEVTVLDATNQKRRILMSTSYREISVTAFHVKIPLSVLKRGMWVNLCLDLSSFVAESFKGQTYRALENIVICANCKLRRIFSMKAQPKDDFEGDLSSGSDAEHAQIVEIPKSMQFSSLPEIEHCTQVLNMKKLFDADIKFRTGSGVSAAQQSEGDGTKSDKSQKTHIAFGSRIAIPKHAMKTGSRALNMSSGLERQVSSSSLSSSGGLNSSNTHIDLNDSASSIPQVEGQRPVLQPRPPKPGSGKSLRRPNPRIRSAESTKLVKRAKVKLDASDNDQGNHKDDTRMPNDETARGTNGTPTAETTNVSEDSGKDSQENELRNGEALDENNNRNEKHQNTESVVGRVSRKLIGMKMGSQEDEEDYFRNRKDSETLEETSRSKDGSFSSSADSEPFFLYSSRPRSISNFSRGRKNSDSNNKCIIPPEVIVSQVAKPDATKSRNRASLESDFQRESSDSDNDDPVTKFHKLSGSQRNSPRTSPLLFSKSSGITSIRSSLLKEIPQPKSQYDHLKYQSVQSDSMSWMYDSDSSQVLSHDSSLLEDSINKQFSPIKIDNDVSPRNPRSRKLDGLPEGTELGNDSDDGLSDVSDETSYSTWKAPPAHIRNYRYQDEIHGVGMTLDLSATLPMTPFIEERPLKNRNIDNTDSGISVMDSKTLNTDEIRESQQELDLVYDPVLNCYYEPKTQKYYELA